MIDIRSMIGTIFDGRYLLISAVRGGMSVVFNAYDRKMGCTVAIKMLDLSLCPPEERPAFKKQFIEEVKAHAAISHPGIVGFKGANLRHDPMYFVMEYADGLTLKKYINRKKTLQQKEIVDFSCQILSALAHIHEKGIVHCDLKPHNIIILRNGKLKLIDFGISRTAGKMPELPPDKAVGTVYYVSPEQAEGKVLDHRSDLYSLGIMIYEMAAGVLPFTHNNPDRVAEMQASAPPRRPRSINSGVSKGLEQIILKALAKKPYMRFADADEMREYLEILRKNPRSVFRLQSKSSDRLFKTAGFSSESISSILTGVCAALVLTAAISFPLIYGNILKGTFGDTVSLTAPDLLGMKKEQAIGRLDNRYYDVEVVKVFNSGKNAGEVVAQFPTPHTKSEVDPFGEPTRFILSVSADPCQLTMIDVMSLSPEEAASFLRQEGYTVTFQQKYSDTVTKGLCCGTFPAAGELAEGGSEVILYVSLGYEINS